MADSIREQLIEALCERNGWEHGEDRDTAIEEVDWFLSTFKRITEEMNG